jgi:hypothetical protein
VDPFGRNTELQRCAWIAISSRVGLGDKLTSRGNSLLFLRGPLLLFGVLLAIDGDASTCDGEDEQS